MMRSFFETCLLEIRQGLKEELNLLSSRECVSFTHYKKVLQALSVVTEELLIYREKKVTKSVS